jgi:uncharacterized membrane protein
MEESRPRQRRMGKTSYKGQGPPGAVEPMTMMMMIMMIIIIIIFIIIIIMP